MTVRRLRGVALWGVALLTGLLAPAPVLARPETTVESKASDRPVARLEQALDVAGEDGNLTPPVERALDELLRGLDEEQHKGRSRRRHDEGGFGAGLQFGDAGAAADAPADNSGPAADSSEGGTDPSAGSRQASGGTGNMPGSTTTAGQSKGSQAKNKQSRGTDSHGHGHDRGHGAFARGLRHAEREWRERREEHLERQVARAFARGLVALRKAEEHLARDKARSAAPDKAAGTAGISTKTADRHEHPPASADHTQGKPAAVTWKPAAVHPPVRPVHTPVTSVHPAGLSVQHHGTVATPAHHVTGAVHHVSVTPHAGSLAGGIHAPLRK
jgi:hypothetical protein